MQIKEANIFNFGKLQNKKYSFSDGINVIYGENEQGKSTLHAFLKGMLFGIEKGRGRTAGGDTYSRYEPWHAPSFYSGAMRFEVDKKQFYLERNFYSKERSAYLRNEEDGEELSVAYGDLDVLLAGIGREEFENTYDITQSGAATGKGMSELLTTYLAEAEAGGTGKIHVQKAQKNLLARKKELLSEQKQLQEKREQQLGQKQAARNVLQQTVEEQRRQIAVFEKEQQEMQQRAEHWKREKNQEEEWEIQEDQKQKRLFLAAGISILFFIGLWYFGVIPSVAAVLFCIICVGVAVFLQYKRMENEQLPKDDTDVETEMEEETGAEALFSHAQMMLGQLKEHLQENENQMINLEEEIEELRTVSRREQELEQDIAAIQLAQTGIENAAREYYLEMADTLNGEISRWISLLTREAYDSAVLTQDGKLKVMAEAREVAPEALSRGTLEQIYLALRLAAGSVLMQEEDMPVFLDEAFAMYDDGRLTETLKALAKTKKQIFIFTCQKREEEILQKEHIRYHLVDMTQ